MFVVILQTCNIGVIHLAQMLSTPVDGASSEEKKNRCLLSGALCAYSYCVIAFIFVNRLHSRWYFSQLIYKLV